MLYKYIIIIIINIDIYAEEINLWKSDKTNALEMLGTFFMNFSFISTKIWFWHRISMLKLNGIDQTENKNKRLGNFVSDNNSVLLCCYIFSEISK